MQKLIYVADPMCSWCWGFRPTIEAVHSELDRLGNLEISYVMGGLAPDSQEPMPAETQAYVQDQWRKVTAETGATFNWDFWKVCKPRRSTYPACRAVIAAERQGKGRAMFNAVQEAYYQEARNPSDLATLSAVAAETGLDRAVFDADIQSAGVEADLQAGFDTRRSLRANEFPTLILQTGEAAGVLLAKGYGDARTVVDRLHAALAQPGAD